MNLLPPEPWSPRRSRRSLLVAAVVVAVLVAGCSTSANSARRPTPTRPAATVIAGSQPTGAARFLGPIRRVRVGDITMGFRQFGHGPNLVLITGSDASMNAWAVTPLQALAAHHRVTIFDNRGVGASTDPATAPLTMQVMASDTVGLMNALGIARSDLLGWSMGGQIALVVTLDHPDRVRRLILVSADPGSPHAVREAPALEALDTDPNVTAQQILGELFPSTAAAAKTAFLNQYLSLPADPVTLKAEQRQEEAFNQWYDGPGVYHQLRHITRPVLVTNGDQDIVVPPVNADLLATHIPGAQHVVFPGAGHAFWFQDVDQFAATVNTFLR